MNTGSTATVTQTGGTPVTLAEPTTPLITFTSPASAAAGQQVTVTGSGFGATQGSSYLTFSDNGTNWGAPPDAGHLHRRQLERQRHHVHRPHPQRHQRTVGRHPRHHRHHHRHHLRRHEQHH